jgi:lambda repressor-like predicted transcriptional regulator
VKPPADLPSVLIALGDSLAARIGVEPAQLWAYLYRRAPPPPAVRAALVEAFYPRVSPDDFLGLPSREENGTLRTMPATDFAAHRTGRPLARPRHPLMAALSKAGVTVAEEAKAVGRSTSSIRSFCYPAKHEAFRPPPRALADHWQKKYGVPLATWPRLAD